jgi:hypothetical protein
MSLQEAHTLIWKFRAEMEPFWATPTPLDSLRYAFTEAGEAMDADLRARRPGDSRNNDRDVDLLDELADCAIMLLTAVDTDQIPDQYALNIAMNTQPTPQRHRLETLCHDVALVMSASRQELDRAAWLYYSWVSRALQSVKWIETYPGMDLLPRIKRRLGRIAGKHLPDDVGPGAAVVEYIENELGIEITEDKNKDTQ